MTIAPFAQDAPLAAADPFTTPADQAAPYTYFSTDWRTGSIREEIPARGVSFNTPINAAGDFTGTYTVPRNGSHLRNSAAPLMSGLRVYRGPSPVWDGYVWGERQTGVRDFEVTASEWKSFFDKVVIDKATLGANSKFYSARDDHVLFYTLLDLAQKHDAGWNPGIKWDAATRGGINSELTVNAWDLSTLGELLQSLSDSQGGPDYAFYPLADGTRWLKLGTPLGRKSVAASGIMFEFVEDTGPAPEPPQGPPRITSIDNLFPGAQSNAVIGRGPHGAGGNIIAAPGIERDGTNSVTEQWAAGAGEEAAKVLSYASAPGLIKAGWPRLGAVSSYSDVSIKATLDRHAAADLAAAAGLKVTVTCTTFGNMPDWTHVQRGDVVRFSYDSDLFDPRPWEFDTRVLDIAVQPDEDGGHEQVAYTLASVQQV